MDVQNSFKSLSSLIGDPVRAIMLWNLLDGKAFSASELAICADVSSQSASMHLNKLVQGNLLTVESQGRHRYYRFSKPEVAYVIEAIANLIPELELKTVQHNGNGLTNSIRYCRTCYDHLAGEIGVRITDQLVQNKILIQCDKTYVVTRKGSIWFDDLGISVEVLGERRRPVARQCLDWSERRHHLSGSLGAAFLEQMLTMGWLKKLVGSRAIIITGKGQKGLYETLNLII